MFAAMTVFVLMDQGTGPIVTIVPRLEGPVTIILAVGLHRTVKTTILVFFPVMVAPQKIFVVL
jgi:hypothetical protein